jgi:putative ABC transport system permease protein
VLRVTLRNLLARKVRLALSAFAIVLGVAFVAGSFVFTDALGGAFNGIIKGTTADVEVLPAGGGDFTAAGEDSRTIPGSVVDDLEALPEVESANGTDQVQGVYVIGADGKLVGGNGPPGLAFNYSDTRAITGDQIFTLVEGDLPEGESQIALDEDTADKAGYEVGDEVQLVTPGPQPTTTATLTGLVKFGSEGGLVGATLTLFDEQTLQDRFFQGRDVYTNISLTAAEGVTQQELADAANEVLPRGVEAQTGDKLSDDNVDAIGEALGFINTFLLVFAAVAIVVGTFLIINTFSILVAQRSRELALLRALGASRRQVNFAVLAEAAIVGLVGSTIGLGAGYLLAIGLRSLFGAFGLDLGGATLTIEPRTVLVSYAVGLVVTMVAAYLPARRASRIAPVAAMRDDAALPESSLRRRFAVGVVLILLGIGLMVGGFAGSGGSGLSLIGGGMLAILVGVSLISPIIGRPVIALLGLVYRRVFSSVGDLATENARRNPRRTAATASALMIGLTLVALMSILGQSAKASTDKTIEESLTAELIVSNAVGTPFSTAIADQIREVEGVETVAQFRQAFPKLDGSQVFLGAANPDDLADALDLAVSTGGVGELANSFVLVDQATASNQGWSVGDTVPLEFPVGTVDFILAGTFPAGGAVPANYLITLDALEDAGIKPLDSLLFINTTDDADESAVRSSIDDILADLPTVTLKDQEGYAAEQKEQINQFLGIIYALLALAIVIAVLGIVNTLALSVIERTREVGLLRAIGMQRRQLRRMIRLEAVAIALLGAALGMVMGIVFGVTLQRAIADQGIEVLSIPWVQLVIFVVISGLVGVLAALLPARRAAKLDVLTAITTE